MREPFRAPRHCRVGDDIFLYVFFNLAMVTGLVPVVGIPLPLVSYGGTSMTTLMLGLGLAMSAYVHGRADRR